MCIPCSGNQLHHLVSIRVARKTYEASGLKPRNSVYVELQGTGMPVGDPIETRAVMNALNDNQSRNEPMPIGAFSRPTVLAPVKRIYHKSDRRQIKPHVGHSGTASGIFAVMKVR